MKTATILTDPHTQTNNNIKENKMLTITDYKTEVIRHMTEYKIPSISFQYGNASYTFPENMDDETSALMMNLFDDRAQLWKHW